MTVAEKMVDLATLARRAGVEPRAVYDLVTRGKLRPDVHGSKGRGCRHLFSPRKARAVVEWFRARALMRALLKEMK